VKAKAWQIHGIRNSGLLQRQQNAADPRRVLNTPFRSVTFGRKFAKGLAPERSDQDCLSGTLPIFTSSSDIARAKQKCMEPAIRLEHRRSSFVGGAGNANT
jgi:hypothetical protein